MEIELVAKEKGYDTCAIATLPLMFLRTQFVNISNLLARTPAVT